MNYRQALTGSKQQDTQSTSSSTSTLSGNPLLAMSNGGQMSQARQALPQQPQQQTPPLTPDLWQHIASFADTETDEGLASLMSLSAVNQAARSGTRRHAAATLPSAGPVGAQPGATDTEQARGRAMFGLATSTHFPDQFSKKKSKKTVEKFSAMDDGFELYNRSVGSQDDGPAYIERLPDKERLFERGMNRPQRQGLVNSGRLFQPPGGQWSPQINDAWMLGNLHRGRDVQVLSPPTKDSLWESADRRPTAMGREALQATRSGYTLGPGPGPTANTNIRGGQQLNAPAGPSTATIQQANPRPTDAPELQTLVNQSASIPSSAPKVARR